jgi:hypothetical protein
MKFLLILLFLIGCSRQRNVVDNKLIIGTGNSSSVELVANIDQANQPYIKFDAVTGKWTFSDDGVLIKPIARQVTEGIGDLIVNNGVQDVRLPVGAEGQVLTARSTSPTGLQWEPKTPLTTKGDILTATGANAETRLPVGANGQFLRANNATTTGLEWANINFRNTIYDFDSVTVYNSNGTFTYNTPANTRKLVFLYCGGGGAGRGTSANDGEFAAGGGGGAGQGRICIINNPAPSYSLVIGAGGVGANNAAGTGGGSTIISGCNNASGGGASSTNLSTGTGLQFSSPTNAIITTDVGTTNRANIIMKAVGGVGPYRINATTGRSGLGGYPIFPFHGPNIVNQNLTTTGNGIAGGNCQGGGGSVSVGATSNIGGNGGAGRVVVLGYL